MKVNFLKKSFKQWSLIRKSLVKLWNKEKVINTYPNTHNYYYLGIIFDSVPMVYEDYEEIIKPYNLETAGINGFRKKYRVHRSQWPKIVSKILN